MAIKPKMITNRSTIDDVIESALEWQERARQNHGVTLGYEKCIEYALKQSQATSVADIATALETIIDIAQAENNNHAN